MPQKRLAFQIVGAIGSLIVAASTLFMSSIGYQMWRSPPLVLTRGNPMRVVELSTIIAEGTILVVGAYLTRQLFYWAGLPETFQRIT